MNEPLDKMIENEIPRKTPCQSHFKCIMKDLTKKILQQNPNAFITINPETGLSTPRIVCAAIKGRNGMIVVGARHYDQ